MKKEAMLYDKLDNNYVDCKLCAHRCKIAPSKFGICGVRQNIDGRLYTLVYADAIASSVDPIEKKPLHHLLPGSRSYSIATVGCNFKCDFCQNWRISQSNMRGGSSYGHELKPEDVVANAKKTNCKSIAYTYTEPTIYFEYAYDTAKLAKDKGLYNVFVTNGYMTKEALDKTSPYLDAANVDLKAFSDEFYKKRCRARLKPVLESIKYMKKLGIWVEVTTLVVTDQNDSKEELENIAKFIAEVGIDIPWHISRFHPDYKYQNSEATSIDTMEMAYKLGKDNGLRYVYMGNISKNAETFCYSCGKLIAKRDIFGVGDINIEKGKCLYCGTKIDGIWE